MAKPKFTEILRLLLIALFVHTATNKLLTVDAFADILGRFPLLKPIARPLSYVIPIAEILISMALIIPKTLRLGLWMALFLMIAFTGYLSYSILGHYQLPCSCGGIISKLDWNQHLIFNLVVIGLIILSIINYKKENTIRVQDMPS